MAKSTWQDKVKDLLDSIHEQLEQHLHTQEDMLKLIQFNQKFHCYSLRNMLLIDSQFKGARAVGSYQFWKEQGFQVQRGEKGIEILTPVKTTLFEDEQGLEKSLKSATKEEKERIQKGELKTRQITTFKIGYVFDVSQTNAKASDLPKIFPNRWIDGTISNYDVFYQGLEKVADSIGVKIVEPRYELGVSKGASYTGLNEVTLNPRNGELQNVKTLLHELAHAKLHTLRTRLNYTQAEREFQAELVAYAVCSHFNLDVSDYSLDYLKHWTKGTNIKDKIHLIEEVYQTSQDYIGVLEEHFELEKEKGKAMEELEVTTDKIQLKECGKLLRHIAWESLVGENEMYFCDVEDFEDLLEDGTLTEETWEEFLKDVEKFKLVENGYLELHTDFENFEQDKDQIDCVMTGYMDFWKQFEYDSFVNHKFPNQAFRKVIVEQLLERHDGTIDIFKSDLEVLKKIEVLNLEKHKLTDVKGIENFESLRKLDISNNPIINLDVSELIGLKELYAYGCQLHHVELPKSETLEILDVTLNNLENLDVEKQFVLRELSCSYNELSELDVTQCPSLEVLQCSDNTLTELNLTNNEALVTLECENNQLELLQIKNISNFEFLNISGNAKSEQELLERETINDLFPNENFRKAILEDVFEQPKDHANRDLYEDQLEAIQSQVVLSVSNSKVSDLTGIEYFKSLKQLDVSYNPIQHLNMSQMCELRSVKAYHCALTEVILPHPEQTNLRYLDVTHNQLETLDLREQVCLQTACLSENQLTEVTLDDCEKLQYLTCSHNRLNELNLKDCYELRALECENNDLSVLDMTNNEELQLLACQNNLLTSLELNHCQDLDRLECANNQLETLGIQSLKHLSYVDCRGNVKSSAELIQGTSKKEKVEELEYGDE